MLNAKRSTQDKISVERFALSIKRYIFKNAARYLPVSAGWSICLCYQYH